MKYMANAASRGSHPLDAMLAISDVVTNQRYAQIYARVLTLDTPTVEELSEGLDSSTTTVYEDVKHLVESGILERVTDTQPHRYRARQINLHVGTDEDSYKITPALFVALARRETNENIQLFLDRHGVSGLATALEYARDYVQGRMNARIMAREQDLPELEAETILQEIRDVLLDVDPNLEESPDVDELDAAVDERSGE
jgi:DNA-binding Lrp family transcriptional regulator